MKKMTSQLKITKFASSYDDSMNCAPKKQRLNSISAKDDNFSQTFCPVCQAKLKTDIRWINLHIDACLKKIQEKSMASNDNISDFRANDGEAYDINIRPHMTIPGLFLVDDFISEDEEKFLIEFIDDNNHTPWKHSSFNGDCLSKTFGVKTQFGLPGEERLVRRNVIEKGEHDIPEYLKPLIDKIEIIVGKIKIPTLSAIGKFKINECNVNSYIKASNHFLRPHYDDRSLSGPLLANLSLLGFCRMTYFHPTTKLETKVELPRRCLQIVSGAARWEYLHSIQSEDIVDERRVSITWRQSGGKKGVKEVNTFRNGP